MRNHPTMNINQTISSIDMKPGEYLDIYMVNDRQRQNVGFVRIALTENNKIVIQGYDEKEKQEDIAFGEWNGHVPFKKLVQDLEDEDLS